MSWSGLEPADGGVPPTTSGLNKAWGSSVNVRSPREELDGVVDVDVVAEAVVADCLRWVRLLERDGARLVAGPYIWFEGTG